jgi:glyoxylase-like metal-dependent hydrolase (beta-lactamase superfamily II)
MNRKDDGILPKNLDPSSFKDIKGGDIFDLGGITLHAYDLPGHTVGSMVFVSPEMRLLFTGDVVGTQSNKRGGSGSSCPDASTLTNTRPS